MKNYFQRLAAAAVRGALKEADKMVADAEKAIVDELGTKRDKDDLPPLPWCKVCGIYHLYANSSNCIERKGKP